MIKQYDKEFKINAVKLYLRNGKSLDQISSDLGVSRSSLCKWVNHYKNNGEKSFPGSGHQADEEVRALKREVSLLKEERDILKKAVAIFSSPGRKGMNL